MSVSPLHASTPKSVFVYFAVTFLVSFFRVFHVFRGSTHI
jgi:hypothetical protein